jgi:CubicO group peptidase (beta-lactamase class C family)
MSSKTTTTTSTEPDGGTTTTTTTETAPVSVAEGECVRDFLPAAPESVGVSSAALGRLTGLLQEMVADRPGLGPSYPHARCKVVKGGKLIYDETSSASGFETPTDDSIYRWYSMSKIVTSVAIMQCFEKGLLKITDPVSKYIPAFGATKVYTGSTKGPAPEPLASLGIPEVPTELQLEELQRQVTI